MKCYLCTDPITGEVMTLYKGKEPVSLCKPCYDKELVKINKAKWEAFKHRNARELTPEEIEQDLNREYENSVRG